MKKFLDVNGVKYLWSKISLKDYPNNETLVTVPEELRLGCYRSNIGGIGRFAKGLLNDCKIYNYAISDEMMIEMLTS